MEGNKQQDTIIDVERQPMPVGGGTTGSGRGRHRRAWTAEELARHAVERRRQYTFSLFVTILMPIMTLVFLVGPFFLTSWDLPSRIVLWVSGLVGIYGSFSCIRDHDRNYGYHPEIPCSLPNPAPTIAEAADEDYAI